jgi:hypothetical protein
MQITEKCPNAITPTINAFTKRSMLNKFYEIQHNQWPAMAIMLVMLRISKMYYLKYENELLKQKCAIAWSKW